MEDGGWRMEDGGWRMVMILHKGEESRVNRSGCNAQGNRVMEKGGLWGLVIGDQTWYIRTSP